MRTSECRRRIAEACFDQTHQPVIVVLSLAERDLVRPRRHGGELLIAGLPAVEHPLECIDYLPEVSALQQETITAFLELLLKPGAIVAEKRVPGEHTLEDEDGERLAQRVTDGDIRGTYELEATIARHLGVADQPVTEYVLVLPNLAGEKIFLQPDESKAEIAVQLWMALEFRRVKGSEA